MGDELTNAALIGLIGVFGIGLVLRAAGTITAFLTGTPQPTAGAAAGIAVLFTEHDMDVVFAHADRLLVLDRGRLIAEGPPEAVRRDPLVRDVYLGQGLG